MAIIPAEQKFGQSFFTAQQQRQKKLIYIFIGVILITAAIVYFGFLKKPTSTNSVPGTISSSFLVEQQNDKLINALKQATLDLPIFKDKKFQSLILFGQFPLVIGEKGRENPFAPF